MPVQSTSGQTDTAYQHIRERILTGEFPPGRTLVAQELSEMIKVSRTPVREALVLLQGEGLVEVKPNVGASVRSLSWPEFRELCCVRFAIESYTAREAARLRQEKDLAEMERQHVAHRQHCEELLAGSDGAAQLRWQARHDIYFHIAIVETTRNQALKSELLRLCLVSRFVRSEAGGQGGAALGTRPDEELAYTCQRTFDQHQAILDAIRAKDVEGARLAMEAHIQSVIDACDQMMVAIRERDLEASFRI